jgi:phosphotransferase system enzyme I (PtsP)
MFPMVATCDEFIRAKAVVERETAYLTRHRHALPSDLKLGVMLEVPSLLFQLDEICTLADFISIGSNDLMQFLFAVDRENRMVANRFDPLCTPSLRALKLIVETAQDRACPVTVCGEIGGRPLEAMALLALGYRSLSMSPTSLGPVKAMLLGLPVGEARTLLLGELERSGTGESLRPLLSAFAKSHDVPV